MEAQALKRYEEMKRAAFIGMPLPVLEAVFAGDGIEMDAGQWAALRAVVSEHGEETKDGGAAVAWGSGRGRHRLSLPAESAEMQECALELTTRGDGCGTWAVARLKEVLVSA